MAAFTIGGDWTWTGNAAWNGGTFTAIMGGNAQITSVFGNATLSSNSGELFLFGLSAQFNTTNDLSIFTGSIATLSVSGGNNLTLNSQMGDVNIDAPGTVNITAPAVALPTLAASVTANIVYFDTVSGDLSYGAAPSSAPAFLLGGQVFGATQYLGSTDANQLNVGTNSVTVLSIDPSQNVTFGVAGSNFNVNAFDSTWNIADRIVINANVGLIFTGGTGADIVFNSPQITLEGADMNLLPTDNISIGTPTASAFLSGLYVLIQSANFVTMDTESPASGHLNIGNANSGTIFFGNSACTNIIIGTTQIILPTPAVSNNTPLLIDTNGTIHV